MYQLTASNSIHRTTDNAFIPPDTGNRDYREYLEWLDAGNEPEPAPPIPIEPTPSEKLAASGLTIGELKQLLGLN